MTTVAETTSDVLDRMRVTLDLSSVRVRKVPRAIGFRALNYTNLLQEQANWCWAAVSTAVDHFYNGSSTSTQCSVANGTLGRTDCCGTGASGPCNVAYYLDQALTDVGHLDTFTGSSYTYDATCQEINTSRPLCIRIGWKGGGGHFLAVVGYLAFSPVLERLLLADPAYGDQTVNYTGLFNDSYQGKGSWTHTYETD